MALTAFGDKTRTLFLKEFSSHNVSQQFTVAAGATIKKGQPVKLNASGDVVPTAGTDGADAHIKIGHSLHNGVAGEVITVVLMGRAIIYATAKTALTPGPVRYVGQDSVDAVWGAYDDTTVTAANMDGWALDVAAAEHNVIRVVLK